jgi:NADP-dependent 3-hydroxy acid dehydrogenase YdfG
MPDELRNRTVVITGASAGVGRAAAHRFARAGARVAMIARDKDALNDVKNEIERLGGTGFVAPADVADSNQVFLAADSILHEFGPFDIWINDAMVTVFSPMWDMTPAEFRRVTEVTYLGMVHGTMAALRHMRQRNRGTIIQVGSALAFRGVTRGSVARIAPVIACGAALFALGLLAAHQSRREAHAPH